MDNENLIRALALLNDILEEKNLEWNIFRKQLFPRVRDKSIISSLKNEIIKEWFIISGGIISESQQSVISKKEKKVLTNEERSKSRESYRRNNSERQELLVSWRERNYKGKLK